MVTYFIAAVAIALGYLCWKQNEQLKKLHNRVHFWGEQYNFANNERLRLLQKYEPTPF